MKLIHRRWD